PKWLREAVLNLSAVDLGNNFKALLEALIHIEDLHGFPAVMKGSIPATGRPVVVGEWIQGACGQRSKKVPTITNIKAYPNSWQAWWDSLQPEWRQRDAAGRYEIGGDYGEEWGGLDCPGANGLLSVVASLYFWGHSRKTSNTTDD
ncbi:hypothetical protein C8J57DRAFT_1034206, partial [Mycena rebaudengoi]